MIDTQVKVIDNRIARIRRGIKPDRSLSRASYLIRQAAQAQFTSGKDASPPGRPPHTRRRRLPKSILYDVDKRREEAVIGPAYHMAGTSGKPHEFGGEYRGGQYPARPFMGPALTAVADQIPRQFAGMLGPTL